VLDEDATIVTARLVLRSLRPEDADEMVEVLRDQQLHDFTGGRPLTLDELRLRYRQLAVGHSSDGKQTWLNWIVRLRASNAAVGTVQATVTGVSGDEHAQIAWVVGVPWQRNGFASEATIALVSWLERRDIRTISANIHPRHVASQTVASRAGLGLTHDLVDGEQVWLRSGAPTAT
jgi:RimJ/RimL family protein N-acetyltransferase